MLPAVLALTTLSACATSGSVPTAIPRDCENLARPVAVPSVQAGDDPRVVLARTYRALALANRNLNDTRACQQKVRKGFGER